MDDATMLVLVAAVVTLIYMNAGRRGGGRPYRYGHRRW